MSKAGKRRLCRAVAAVIAAVIFIYVVFQSGTYIMGAVKKPWKPTYEQENLSELLEKDELTDEDYAALYRQTGLTKIGVDRILTRETRDYIHLIQQDYFDKTEPQYDIFGTFIGSFEREMGHYSYVPLEDGDVVCCLSTYLSFFHIGHCGIVVSGEFNLLAESEGYSSVMETVHATEFFNAASFVVLRVKTDEKTKAQVTNYVMEQMLGTRYDFLTGIFEPKATEPLRATHCSHAVWYAYNRFGIDLDSDGGKIVSPRQLALSPFVEVVQIRGIDPALFDRRG